MRVKHYTVFAADDFELATKNKIRAIKCARTLQIGLPLKDAKAMLDDACAGFSGFNLEVRNDADADAFHIREEEIAFNLAELNRCGFNVHEMTFDQVPFVHDDDNVNELLKKAAIAAITQNNISIAREILYIIQQNQD